MEESKGLSPAILKKIENEDNLWKCVEAKQEYIPYLPPRITFITSKRCNLACRMCYHFRHKYTYGISPMNMPVMDPRLLRKVADELFSTLQYYETTLLGDPFLSPHLETELEFASRHEVYMRPTTNGTTLSDENLDLVSGHMDWLKCSFDSHIRGVYNSIRIGARYDNTIRKLKNFNKRRENMRPIPYFRMGLVMNDLNLEEIPDYFLWCHEYMGVDDVEIMGLNVDADYIECMAVFDKPRLVNKTLDKLIDIAISHKYKLRLDFTRMPLLHGDRFVCQKRSAEIREAQKQYGFVPPRNFEKMSYVIQNQRNRWEIGDVGYVWSNNMRDQSVCIEFMNRPFILNNGNVEVCGNCNTFMPGNLKREPFSRIWNNSVYRYIRRKMYAGEINRDWPDACNDCICMGVTYDRGRSDHRRKPFYRVVGISPTGRESRAPVGLTHAKEMEFDGVKDLASYVEELEARATYEHVPPATTGCYVSDLDATQLGRDKNIFRDSGDAFTPLLLDRRVYSKGLLIKNGATVILRFDGTYGRLKGVAGFYDNLNQKSLTDAASDSECTVDISFVSKNGDLLVIKNLKKQDPGKNFEIDIMGVDELRIKISSDSQRKKTLDDIVMADLMLIP